MKTWHIFAIGIFALLAMFFMPFYDRVIAAMAALIIVAVVLFGFLARPRREVFYLQTTSDSLSYDGEIELEHDCIAVRVELVRLWLLFAPTFLAVAYLTASSARGTTWQFHIVGAVLDAEPSSATYWFLYLGRGFLVGVTALLSAWVGERWTLRDANASNARHAFVRGGRVSFSFTDTAGEYYGGESVLTGVSYPPELATIVLYNVRKPELNKIAVSLVFHKLIVIGRGITDLDNATVEAHAARIAPVRSAI